MKDDEGAHVRLGTVHEKILDFKQEAYERKVKCLVLAPRGIGKTTLLVGEACWIHAKHPTHRVAIISDNEEHGIDRVTTVRHYLEKDKHFRWLFPEVKIDYSVRGRRTMAKLRLTANPYAKDPTLLGAGIIGGGTGTRMDEQLFDDLCTERNTILQPAEMERVKKAYFGTWRACLKPKTGWSSYIGTLYHENDLTHALKESKKVARLVIGLDPETFGHYNVEEWWPGWAEPKHYTLPLWDEDDNGGPWSQEAYEDVKDEMAVLGEATKFFAAYCNLIIDPETASFRREWFKRSFVMKAYDKYPYRTQYADPATTANKKSCFYAGVVLGWDSELKAGVVLEAWRTREPLTSKANRYLDVYEKVHPHVAAIEGQHEGSFADRVDEMALERGLGLKVKRPTHGQTDKEARIAALSPLIENGKILVDLERFPFFWKEASVFPAGRLDALDALEGAWSLMRRWVKGKTGVPTKFPVAQQGQGGKTEPHRYHFARRRGIVAPAGRSTADIFFG